MIMKKTVIICYTFCLIFSSLSANLLFSSNSLTFEQDTQKSKKQIVQLVEENDRLVTECQKLFDTICQEIEQANKIRASWLTINEYDKNVKHFTEQATSFFEMLQEYKKAEKDDSLLHTRYKQISASYHTLEKTLESVIYFMHHNRKKYKQLVDSIKTNMQKLEDNTPLKKSISLQFFNATKQLESALNKFTETIVADHAANDWLLSHTTLIIEKNKNFKNNYLGSIDQLKNDLELLETCHMPDDSLNSTVDDNKILYLAVKNAFDTFLDQKQQKNSFENMIKQSEQEKKSMQDKAIHNIQHTKNHTEYHTETKVIQNSKIKTKGRDKEIALLEKKELARLKAAQKQAEKIKKQEERQQKKALIALQKKDKKQNRDNIAETVTTDQSKKNSMAKEKSPTESVAIIAKPHQNLITFQEIALAQVTKAYSQTIKELELLQQQEEHDNTLMTAHHERYIILESDMENLEKQVNLFISIAHHLKIKDTQPTIYQTCQQEYELIHDIKRLNAEQHAALIKQQFIKEQNNIKLEELLQATLKLYEIELEELKKQQRIDDLEKIVQTYETTLHEHKQKIKELKEKNRIKTDKLVHTHKILQHKLKEFETSQNAQSELLQTALLSTKQIDTLTAINKQQLELYKKFISSQKVVTNTHNKLLQAKKGSQDHTSHQTSAEKKNTPKEQTPQKKQSQQEQLFSGKTDHELIDIIEKKRRETVYQLQELQYHEEKGSLLRASLHDQEAYAQEQLASLRKQTDLYQDFLQESSCTQSAKDTLKQICHKQKNHIHVIEKTNEEIEQLLMFQQNLNEQHTFEQEDFLKKIYQTYNTKLEFFKKSPQKSYADNLIQQEDFYTLIKKQEDCFEQKVEAYKKESSAQKNKILEKEKLIQEELQALKNLESTSEKIVYASECHHRDQNDLELLQKKHAQLLELCIRSQQAIEQKIDVFLSDDALCYHQNI